MTELIFKNDMISSDNLNRIYIYKSGEVLAKMDRIESHIYDAKNRLVSEYSRTVKKVYLHSDLKRAIKLNLNRKDNFYILNKDREYSFEPAYNLYINADNVKFENLGEQLANHSNDQTYYYTAYKITFDMIIFSENRIEKIPYEGDYTLKNHEEFSDCFGSDKDHACVKYYDHSKMSPRLVKKHNLNTSEKGVIKKWCESVTCENTPIITRYPFYTRIDKTPERQERENIADAINSCLSSLSQHISQYDVQKMLTKLNISIKEA